MNRKLIADELKYGKERRVEVVGIKVDVAVD